MKIQAIRRHSQIIYKGIKLKILTFSLLKVIVFAFVTNANPWSVSTDHNLYRYYNYAPINDKTYCLKLKDGYVQFRKLAG